MRFTELRLLPVILVSAALACSTVAESTGPDGEAGFDERGHDSGGQGEETGIIMDVPVDAPADAPSRLPDVATPHDLRPGADLDVFDLPDASSPPDGAELPDAPAQPDLAETPDVGADTPPEVVIPPDPLPYPEKTLYQVKGIQPDHWPDKNEIAGNGAGSVAMNLVWYGWEGAVKEPPCGEAEQEYDGRCFAVSDGVDGEIRDYTEKGVVVTAVVYGVPEWARQNIACSPIAPGFEVFCAPDDPADYARFAGMLARRYSGLNGNGRIADFVIHNEVNSNDWFDIGCGQGVACDKDQWIDVYAANYAAAFDAIIAEQPHAKVLMSFTHHFDTVFDKPADSSPLLSVKTFVTAMEQKLGDREWRVAYHPYPPDLLAPAFSPDDLPKVTYGNIGVIVGWLSAAFPQHPHAWDVELTESGVNSLAPQSSPEAQADGVCRSLYNVVATPGISNYIYHRMKDHPVEVAAGIGLGMVTEYGDFKPSWVTWALSNRIELDPPQLSCGFENLPYTRLVRGYKGGRGHWASTRLLPDGFAEEQVYRLSYSPQPGSIMLYECMLGDDNFVSKSADCEGQQPMGPLGYIAEAPFDGGVALYRCYSESAEDHMIAHDPNCESYETEKLLGYAAPW